MHLRKSRPKLVILKPYTYITLVPFSQQRYLRNNDAAVAAQGDRPPHNLYLVLDNVRSAYNVGSIFRTADTANCAEVVTCGFTPHPPHPKLAKTAFGALSSVPTDHVESTLHAGTRHARRAAPTHRSSRMLILGLQTMSMFPID